MFLLNIVIPNQFWFELWGKDVPCAQMSMHPSTISLYLQKSFIWLYLKSFLCHYFKYQPRIFPLSSKFSLAFYFPVISNYSKPALYLNLCAPLIQTIARQPPRVLDVSYSSLLLTNLSPLILAWKGAKDKNRPN